MNLNDEWCQDPKDHFTFPPNKFQNILTRNIDDSPHPLEITRARGSLVVLGMGVLSAFSVLVWSAENLYKSDFVPVDSSTLQTTKVTVRGDTLHCDTSKLALSFRLGPHVLSAVSYTHLRAHET